MISSETCDAFLRRIGHRVALVGRKPRDPHAPKSKVLWPAEQSDPVDEALGLSREYASVYANLNPLTSEMLRTVPAVGVSVRDAMIARRTRLLVDVDAHDCDKAIACEQAEAIRARYGEPLLFTDSGNGFGLIYQIDYPNDEDSKRRVELFLQQLKSQFPCVDDGVWNAGRLTRVIGTMNGDTPTALLGGAA